MSYSGIRYCEKCKKSGTVAFDDDGTVIKAFFSCKCGKPKIKKEKP